VTPPDPQLPKETNLHRQSILSNGTLTTNGWRRGEVYGNCWQAAIATVLDVPLESVPHFGQFLWGEPAVRLWARGMGLDYMERAVPDGDASRVMPDYDSIEGRGWMVAGPTIRGSYHIVAAMKNGDMWDPHPSGAGLTTIKELCYFVKWPNDDRTCWQCGEAPRGGDRLPRQTKTSNGGTNTRRQE
jgi:hypothetical protein